MVIIHLKEIRQKKGLSIKKLAKLSGVSSSYISEIENEIKMPTILIICKLAKGLKCSPYELFSCEGDEGYS